MADDDKNIRYYQLWSKVKYRKKGFIFIYCRGMLETMCLENLFDMDLTWWRADDRFILGFCDERVKHSVLTCLSCICSTCHHHWTPSLTNIKKYFNTMLHNFKLDILSPWFFFELLRQESFLLMLNLEATSSVCHSKSKYVPLKAIFFQNFNCCFLIFAEFIFSLSAVFPWQLQEHLWQTLN